ncbi:hypothetical protein H109_06668 [Trichophyton interdigitale MR816]|uniref:Zinc/iron permease n=1 Tax=Trichophyton interdigitale (strain MR816) TaxID=1215338 RepID=A0A059J0N8_TRIIM|nr:hypothetical protein H101_07650 [Trichophyton interdigitale H6]KDB21420.1 hypothetical protein H109_06668 [Trichophyton interdigitale MR816]
MDGLFTLVCLSLLMGAASFIVGSLPLTFSLSSSQLRLMSALGMGLLVGTSLIVIIPEGVETLYSSRVKPSQQGHESGHRRRDVLEHSIGVQWNHRTEVLPVPRSINGNGIEDEANWRLSGREEASPEADKPQPDAPVDGEGSDDGKGKKEGKEDDRDKNKPDGQHDDNEHEHEHGHKHEHGEDSGPHAWIGVGLVSGFILMYLVDKLPQYASSSSKQQQRPYHISLDNLGSGIGRGISPARTSGGGSRSGSSNAGIATTAGLVIHAAADGIALGASTSNMSLSLIIFVAIMVHKAPASFGLTSVLLKQGHTTKSARAHLLVFSLAAPVGALLTWVVAHTILAGHASDEQSTRWRTGMLLLFSAGTFLYVAMHTMQENPLEPARRESHANGYVDGRDPPQRPKQSMRDLVASVVGMMLPLFLQVGHAH